MTLEERVEEIGRLHYDEEVRGIGDVVKNAILRHLREVVAEEREACARQMEKCARIVRSTSGDIVRAETLQFAATAIRRAE